VKKWTLTSWSSFRLVKRELLFPSVRGLWEALTHFLETCQIWNGEGDPPPVHSPLYVSIMDEIKERTGAGKGELPVGDPWDMFLPTAGRTNGLRIKGDTPGLEEGAVALGSEPAAALSRLRVVQDMFGGLRGDVRVCDPYVDSATLDMLAHLDRAASIKLLSVNIKDKGGIVRDTKAFIAEHGKPLEIRLGPKGQLHDRYVIHDDGMLLVGTSLNSIGLKQSFLVAPGGDIRQRVAVLRRRLEQRPARQLIGSGNDTPKMPAANAQTSV
jgi:hypothetical protein